VTSTIRAACATGIIVLAVIPSIGGRAQAPSASIATRSGATQTATAANEAIAAIGDGKKTTAVFADDGPVDTAWGAQIESFWHALVRLPVAAVLSSILAFRPRRRGTPKRQAPVIQTQIVLALVGAMVMMVVGASLIRYRAKIEDPKDAGVMLSTLAIGLASGVGLYVFAVFAAGFVLVVLLVIESIDPEPYVLFNLTIVTKDSTALKDLIEGVFQQRRIPYELRSTATEGICYEVKLPLEVHTDTISEALISLKPAETIDVKWEQQKQTR
jgi:hypothetical protein